MPSIECSIVIIDLYYENCHYQWQQEYNIIERGRESILYFTMACVTTLYSIFMYGIPKLTKFSNSNTLSNLLQMHGQFQPLSMHAWSKCHMNTWSIPNTKCECIVSIIECKYIVKCKCIVSIIFILAA